MADAVKKKGTFGRAAGAGFADGDQLGTVGSNSAVFVFGGCQAVNW